MKVMKMDEAKPFNVPVPPAFETSVSNTFCVACIDGA